MKGIDFIISYYIRNKDWIYEEGKLTEDICKDFMNNNFREETRISELDSIAYVVFKSQLYSDEPLNENVLGDFIVENYDSLGLTKTTKNRKEVYVGNNTILFENSIGSLLIPGQIEYDFNAKVYFTREGNKVSIFTLENISMLWTILIIDRVNDILFSTKKLSPKSISNSYASRNSPKSVNKSYASRNSPKSVNKSYASRNSPKSISNSYVNRNSPKSISNSYVNRNSPKSISIQNNLRYANNKTYQHPLVPEELIESCNNVLNYIKKLPGNPELVLGATINDLNRFPGDEYIFLDVETSYMSERSLYCDLDNIAHYNYISKVFKNVFSRIIFDESVIKFLKNTNVGFFETTKKMLTSGGVYIIPVPNSVGGMTALIDKRMNSLEDMAEFYLTQDRTLPDTLAFDWVSPKVWLYDRKKYEDWIDVLKQIDISRSQELLGKVFKEVIIIEANKSTFNKLGFKYRSPTSIALCWDNTT